MMTPEQISIMEDILLITITLIVGGIIGYVGRYFQYEWNRKSLRDKKLLEGEITTIHDFVDYSGKITSIFLNSISFLETGYYDVFKKFYTEYMFMRLEYQRKISMLFFYLEENSLIGIAEYLKDVGRFNKICDSIYVRNEKVTEQELKELKEIFKKIDNGFNDVRDGLKEELGFEQKIEIGIENEEM